MQIRLILILLLGLGFSGKLHSQLKVEDFIAGNFKSLPYRLFVPKTMDPSKKYPLVLYLHGTAGRGKDNITHLTKVKQFWVFAEDSIQTKYPCFLLIPQCPLKEAWVNTNFHQPTYSVDKIPMSKSLAKVVELIDSLTTVYNIDTNKLIVTGASMGGFATWDLISRFPNKFSAAIPICGGGDPTQAWKLVNTPVYFFHSNDDNVVPVEAAMKMDSALRSVGSKKAIYKEYTGYFHAPYKVAYKEPGLIDWIFSNKTNK